MSPRTPGVPSYPCCPLVPLVSPRTPGVPSYPWCAPLALVCQVVHGPDPNCPEPRSYLMRPPAYMPIHMPMLRCPEPRSYRIIIGGARHWRQLPLSFQSPLQSQCPPGARRAMWCPPWCAHRCAHCCDHAGTPLGHCWAHARPRISRLNATQPWPCTSSWQPWPCTNQLASPPIRFTPLLCQVIGYWRDDSSEDGYALGIIKEGETVTVTLSYACNTMTKHLWSCDETQYVYAVCMSPNVFF